MTFQFLCPRGHLLEADESQAGQASSCPHCGGVFLVPSGPPSPSVASAQAPGAAVSDNAARPAAPAINQPAGAAPGIRITVEKDHRLGDAERAAAPTLLNASQAEIVHIPCPAGHELETPREYLGHYAMCPACQAKFWLRLEDSTEYRQQKAAEEERREARRVRLLIRGAILAGAVVLVGLGGLLALSWMR